MPKKHIRDIPENKATHKAVKATERVVHAVEATKAERIVDAAQGTKNADKR